MHWSPLLTCLILSTFLVIVQGECKRCDTPIPPDWTNGEIQHSCGQNNVTYTNGYCWLSLVTINMCMISDDVTGIQYAGSCGCPNNCLVENNHGNCYNETCACAPGWTGPDCSQVNCASEDKNQCSGNGACGSLYGLDFCNCTSEYTGPDCSTRITPTQPIPEVIPSTQFSNEDIYGLNHPIFNFTTIAQIKITMNPADLQYLLDPVNAHSSVYQRATFWFDNSVVTKNMPAVGIRLKGNSSRGYAKKTFKISFTEFDDDNDWDQIEKISLKGFQTDNSYIRDAMATVSAYSMNVYMQRFGWAELYINEQSFGFYYLGEEVDKQYLDSRFGTNDGPLYKCTANLTYVGPDSSDYKNLMCGESDHCYDPKTKEADDYTQLANFISVLNTSPNDTFAEEIEKVLDVDLFLRTFVWEVATANWDGLRDSNNFYLFMSPVDGLWKYIRHDNDMSFGQAENFMNITTNDIYHWADGPKTTYGRFLYDRILTVPEFKLRYSQYLQEFFDKFFQFEETSSFRSIARDYQLINSDAVIRDVAHSLDSGFTYETFNKSFTQTIQRPATLLGDGEVIYSFTDFMSKRIASAQEQLYEFFHEY